MTEINVTDVMRGDWVLYEHKNSEWETVSTHYLKVENITKYSLCMRNGDYWRAQKTGLGVIKPIPLTVEILENNDFRHRRSVEWGDFYTYTYTIKQNDKVLEYEQHFNLSPDPYEGNGFHWIPEMSAVSALRVVYVHELQQLLRLCKIEKEIIL